MQTIISYFIYIVARLFHATYRYRYLNNESLQEIKPKNFILAIWHQNLFAGILAQTGKSHVVIISKSKDASPVAFVCNKLGHKSVRGSSKKLGLDKGGKVAKDEMIECLKIGIPGAVTVDGPKGPAFHVKPGIIDMAQKAGVVIVPYSIASSSFWEFKSWDKFHLPKPFAKVLIMYGDPIDVSDTKVDFSDYLIKVENSLNSRTDLVNEQLNNWKNCSRTNWHQV